MADQGCDLGLIGLGVMGRNFALNVADHGFSVAGYDLDADKVQKLGEEKTDRHDVRAGSDIKEFIGWLRVPRAVMLLVPAGEPVDSVIKDIAPLLDTGDHIIDSGNSRFVDTDRRSEALAEKGLLFMGMGMSGGAAGARHGPSLMPGGPKDGYERVRSMMEAASAHVDGDPCVTHLGAGSAGHYVKMVHNGIEYGIMQLIAEAYDLMKRGMGLEAEALHKIFNQWNQSELNAYLIEITAAIFAKQDDKTGNPLVDMVLDHARQKGTGKWVSWDAMDLQVATPTIDSAVMMRNLSSQKSEREYAGKVLNGPSNDFRKDNQKFIGALKNALYAAMILTYAQGMALLTKASESHRYGLNLEAVARIWRGGCIIRAGLLEDIRCAYRNQGDLTNVLLNPHLAQEVMKRQDDLRAVVRCGVDSGLPVPAFMASLSYFDAYRSARLPANLVQAQRDYFGSHTYERVDIDGVFHTQWAES
jgi:6-phosphogluconate dehydrogenase